MKRFWIQRLVLIISDLFSLGLAFLCAVIAAQRYHNDLANSPWTNFFHFGVSKLLGLIIIAVFAFDKQYTKRRPFWEELRQIYKIVGFFIIINLGLAFTMEKGSLKVMIVAGWFAFAGLLPLLRGICKLVLIKAKLWDRDLFILGTPTTALNAYQLFVCNSLMGYNLIAFVAADDGEKVDTAHSLPAPLISQRQFIELVKANPYCDIIVAEDYHRINQNLSLINFLLHNCLNLLILPPISGVALFGAAIEHFFGNDQLVLRLNNNLAEFGPRLLKRGFDLLCVIIGIILLLPVFLGIGLAIKLTTGAKVFYLHKRVGRHGRPFYCIKFQTMYPDSQERLEKLLATNPQLKAEWETNFKLKDDPRVTPIGRILRQTSLDELPQLFNVLIGDMSLVGPRPIIDAEISRYQDGFYYYQLVLPGITGLWQVSGRSDADYPLRVRLDGWYVKNWSLWYDIVILIKTVNVVLKRSGAY